MQKCEHKEEPFLLDAMLPGRMLSQIGRCAAITFVAQMYISTTIHQFFLRVKSSQWISSIYTIAERNNALNFSFVIFVTLGGNMPGHLRTTCWRTASEL